MRLTLGHPGTMERTGTLGHPGTLGHLGTMGRTRLLRQGGGCVREIVELLVAVRSGRIRLLDGRDRRGSHLICTACHQWNGHQGCVHRSCRASGGPHDGRVLDLIEHGWRDRRPRAVRAVGTACATNPLPIVVPCHRVVRSDGSLGGYVGGVEAKTTLLTLEGAA